MHWNFGKREKFSAHISHALFGLFGLSQTGLECMFGQNQKELAGMRFGKPAKGIMPEVGGHPHLGCWHILA